MTATSDTELQRIQFMESEIYSLLSYFDAPRMSIYGLLDALSMLFFEPIDFAIFLDNPDIVDDKGKILFLSVHDVTLRDEFRKTVCNDAEKIFSTIRSRKTKIGLAVQLLKPEDDTKYPLYISLYRPTFEPSQAFKIVNPSDPADRKTFMLLSSLVGRLVRSSMRPLLQKYMEKIEEETLKVEYTPANAPFDTEQSSYNKSLHDILFSEIKSSVSELYSIASRSPLLRSMPGQKFSNFTNIWFMVSTPLIGSDRRSFGNFEYEYRIQIVIPDNQRSDLEALVIEELRNSCADPVGTAKKILDDCQLPTRDERSVLDRPFSSGILSFSDPLGDRDDYTSPMENGPAPDYKLRRNSATKRLFSILFPDCKLISQQFIVHVAGAPLMAVTTISSETMTGEEGGISPWLHHYYFYSSVMKTHLSRKFKKSLKMKYYVLIDGWLSRTLRRAAPINASGIPDAVRRLRSEINPYLWHLSISFPFNRLLVLERPPRDINRGYIADDGSHDYDGALLYKFDRDDHSVYIMSDINRYFHHHIPFRRFHYSNDIGELIRRNLRTYWGGEWNLTFLHAKQ